MAPSAFARAAVLAVIVAAMAALLLMARPVPSVSMDPLQLSYVTTAHQLGVVGYRDPAGAVSPDGKLFAYSEGRFIRVVPIGGGAPITLAPGEGQIRSVAWRSNHTVMAEETGTNGHWWLYDIGSGQRRRLWSGAADIYRQLTWTADGSEVAGVVNAHDGPQLVRMNAIGISTQQTRLFGRASFPAFMPDGALACIVDARISMPCGGAQQTFEPDVDVDGPIAFGAGRVYFASPAGNGMVALWAADLNTKKAHQVSFFTRDAYGPSISADGTVVFKTQTYRTHLADVGFEGGSSRQLTTFQSETPSYHPSRPLIAFTYGTWRRVVDDAKYPDIAQEIGVIDLSAAVPAGEPSEVIAESDSEDQAMAWSPNGKWIAFHTHREMSDDVWLRPADGGQPDKRITFLGRGAEVGWPRWSPDGKTVLLNGARKRDGASVLYTIGVDQESGEVTTGLREVPVSGIAGEMGHAEWLPGGESVVAIVKEGPGRQAIVRLPIAGGRPASVIHRFESEHDFSGLGLSSNGRFAAFSAPAPDGYYQIFVKAVALPTPAVQLTKDPSNKTQPAFSPDGARVAFTVWSYEAAFWSFKER